MHYSQALKACNTAVNALLYHTAGMLIFFVRRSKKFWIRFFFLYWRSFSQSTASWPVFLLFYSFKHLSITYTVKLLLEQQLDIWLVLRSVSAHITASWINFRSGLFLSCTCTAWWIFLSTRPPASMNHGWISHQSHHVNWCSRAAHLLLTCWAFLVFEQTLNCGVKGQEPVRSQVHFFPPS